ncbi:MAG: metal-dependent transcriptional regulator [Acidobacteria bacterium]|nr:metal-dependent transcriptional regulator [Acidobacteriota bacterium]
MNSTMLAPVLALALLIAFAVFLPRFGVLARVRHVRALRQRADDENALKHLLSQQHAGHAATFQSLAGALRLSDRRLMALVARLEQHGLATTVGPRFSLTPEGERVALQVVRAHRLWERYLADEARLPLSRIHAEAEHREHHLTPDEVDRLEAFLGHPTVDPHGDPIPSRDGRLADRSGTPITQWDRGRPGRIVHLEDEPPLAYAQLVAEGLAVGQVVRVIDATPERLVLSDGENEYRLAPLVAGNVFLSPVESMAEAIEGTRPLSAHPAGVPAEIVALDPACRGFSRRRLLDLGFTSGTELTPVLDTFAGDPRGYRVRGTTIALRRDQASQILVRDVA